MIWNILEEYKTEEKLSLTIGIYGLASNYLRFAKLDQVISELDKKEDFSAVKRELIKQLHLARKSWI